MGRKYGFVCLLGLFMSCSHHLDDIYSGSDEGEKNEEIRKEDFFDYITTRSNRVLLDYGIKGHTGFVFYDEYPYEQIGNTWELKAIDAIYAGITDENGRTNCEILWPASLQKVWLVTDNPVVASPVELELAPSGISVDFNYQDYLRELKEKGMSRGVMENGVRYPDGYDILGTWTASGVPDYLLPENEKIELPAGFLSRCGALSGFTSKMVPLLDAYPELKTSGNNDMVITRNTTLVATYFKSSAAWENMVAYYTYKEGESLDVKNIRKTVLFPRYNGKTPVTLLGAQVKLRYWNESTRQYQDEFPKGTHIGWVLLGCYGQESWNMATPNVYRYSNPAYNSDGKQRSVLLKDTERDNYFFMMMEDNVDARFNDVQFSITSGKESVEAPPVIPDEIEDINSYVVKGSLAFEDNWPEKGDYDMNDVVVYFSVSMMKSLKTGNMVRSVMTFTPRNNGAKYTNGFGIQFDEADRSMFKTLKVNRDDREIPVSFEEGTEKPVLLLFSNTASVLGETIKIEVDFNDGVNEKEVYPPYNPFIYVNDRSHEVHLPGYASTDKADSSLRGTGSDLASDSNGKEMFYMSKDNMPFAIHISGTEFQWPAETVSVTEYYPQFQSWRDSFGKTNTDWYKYPKS